MVKPGMLSPGRTVTTSLVYSNGEFRVGVERVHHSDGTVEVKAWQYVADGQRVPLACKTLNDIKWLETDGYYVDGDITIHVAFGGLFKRHRRPSRRVTILGGGLEFRVDICPKCEARIDPEVCYCGTPINEHSGLDGHTAVPMGCECHKPRSARGPRLQVPG